MNHSLSHCRNGSATVSTFQKILRDMFLVFSTLTVTCCLTLHRAGLNDLNTPISIEYAEGNRLAFIFYFTSLGLILVTALIYKSYGCLLEAVILFGVNVFLSIVIASKPHSVVHFYSFYATVGGAVLAPIFALCRRRMWYCVLGLISLSMAVILLCCWAAVAELEIGSLGIAQRAWFIVAWLSNASVFLRFQQVAIRGTTDALQLR